MAPCFATSLTWKFKAAESSLDAQVAGKHVTGSSRVQQTGRRLCHIRQGDFTEAGVEHLAVSKKITMSTTAHFLGDSTEASLQLIILLKYI